jgi:UDP-N-acetyl-D-mannosaminuronate dehydrogenase
LEERQILVVGVGEVGGALAEVLERKYVVARHDLERQEVVGPIEVMHLCFPFKTRAQFVDASVGYINRFKPALTIVNSTVVPGTVREITTRANAPVAYSPVRGKHARMTAELLHYTKFVAALDSNAVELATEHFRAVGMSVRSFDRLETLELAKLAETTYFGVLIAFAQELNRLAERVGGDYAEAIEFFEDVDFLPRTRYFPGVIGGHCVIPNIGLLRKVARSSLFEAVLKSNRLRAAETAAEEPAALRLGLGRSNNREPHGDENHGR